MERLTPATETEAAAIVAEAAGRGGRLAVEGGGTRGGGARDERSRGGAVALSSVGLTGITLHEPAEMVISARAGTPLSAVEARLAGHGQRLPFEPFDHRALLGSRGEPTIGAVAAANVSGPRRVQAGAARDSLIGVRFVNGRGEIIASGGRVMKNVTGLDLVKLQAGARGRLGLLLDVTFKVLPRPPASATLVIEGLDDAAGIAALSDALGSPFEISGAAHVPRFDMPSADGAPARTFLRIENTAEAVAYRTGRLVERLARFGRATPFAGDAEDEVWREVAGMTLAAAPEDAVYALAVKPSDAPRVVERVRAERPARAYYDWGGARIVLATPAEGDAGAEAIAAAIAAFGGHARMERGPLRDAVNQRFRLARAPAVRRLEDAVALAVDPAGVFADAAE
jgi:glycolate oxidase FAD binding subunit